MSTLSSMIKMIVLAYVLVILFPINVIDAKIGVTWGRISSTQLVPSMVVDLLLQNKVEEARIFNDDDSVIEAFGGSNIGLSIGVSNPKDVNSSTTAIDFIQDKIAAYPSTKIRYVVIGSMPALSTAKYLNEPFDNVVKAIKFMQEALNESGYGEKIKAVITNSFSGVLKPNITKPSDAEFLDDLKEPITEILDVYKQNDSPFLIDFFPIAYINAYNIEPNYVFFDNKSSYVIHDNGFIYTNLFEFVHDSFLSALCKLGANKTKIVVSQIGWPTDGFPGANVVAAERFYKGLLPFSLSNKGTPLRPGRPIDIYVHSLTDEKQNPAGIPFTRHWGIFMSNGEPKYNIDLSGQGRDEIFPNMAKGINRMPSRWCVYNADGKDTEKVMKEFTFACANADCTSLAPGGSCSMLNFRENVSYAFNMYFQYHFQNESMCKFDGLGQVVVENPSRNGCVFPVETVKGNKRNKQLAAAYGNKRLHVDAALFLVLISIFLVLF
ncbi:hypothetical protein ACJIZ3_014150 [Penstemon smallii]|uniref:X8 domain-containing protein n=1 Tax=Penstemon smallii TaxID=265156 RepID=A0ABD3RIR3_9LAMI